MYLSVLVWPELWNGQPLDMQWLNAMDECRMLNGQETHILTDTFIWKYQSTLPNPWAYALFPCPLQRFCGLSFGLHLEVMNQIFDPTDERHTTCIRHQTGQVRFVIVQPTFCPLHIRYIFVLSVTHPLLKRQSPLVGRSLFVTYPLHIRYSCVLCAPYTFREDPHRHRDLSFSSPDKHRINISLRFFLFVRRPLPLSVNM